MNRLRLEFAAGAMLGALRKEFVSRYPNREMPIKNLEDYSEADRASLMNALEIALRSADPTADASFEAWRQRRDEKRRETT